MKLLYSLLNLFLLINLIQSYQYTSIQYLNNGCSGKIVAVHSSTLCSPLGKYQYLGNGTVGVTVAADIKSISDCDNVNTIGYNETINKCTQGYFKSFINENGEVALAEGFCGVVTTFDNNCSYLQLDAYINGACSPTDDPKVFWHYLCDGVKVNRYNCSSSDCLSGCSNTPTVLPSIEQCPSITVKPLSEITTDGSVCSDGSCGSEFNGAFSNISSFNLTLLFILSIIILSFF